MAKESSEKRPVGRPPSANAGDDTGHAYERGADGVELKAEEGR